MTVYNVKLPVIMLVEADNPAAAISKAKRYLERGVNPTVDTSDADNEANAFESEELADSSGVLP